MSAHKFACPLCAQHIECDDQYAGMQIKCPACQADIAIPQAPPPPRPVVRVASKAAHSAPSAPSEHTEALRPASVSGPGMGSADSGDTGSKRKKVLTIAALVILAPAVIYVVVSVAIGMQGKFNEAREKDKDPGLIGGQVSHISELYNVLDATDPDKQSRYSSSGDPEPGKAGAGTARRNRSVTLSPGGAAPTSSGTALESLPVVAPAWTLDLAMANIPNSKINGSLAGTNFNADSAWLFSGGAVPVLAFRQGTGRTPDRELLVSLRLKPGEKIEGKSWTITKDQPTGAPSVIKKWRTDPKFAPQQKVFSIGYAMKLEFGQATDGQLPGKIYLALPDAEQSVVAGSFNATIRVLDATGRPASPGDNPSYGRDE